MNFSPMHACLFALVSLPLAACNASPSEDDSDDGGASGSGGTGGVTTGCEAVAPSGLVTFAIGDEALRVGTQNDEFFAEASRLLETGETRVPVFNRLIDGTGCDPQWSWHPDPSDMEFADFTIELCDGTPSYIEENKSEWFATVGSYCPWSARVEMVAVVRP